MRSSIKVKPTANVANTKTKRNKLGSKEKKVNSTPATTFVDTIGDKVS